MTFEIVDDIEFYSVVEMSFLGDTELFEKYHVINGNEKMAIEDTKERILDIQLYLPMEKYILVKDGQVIGFTCLSKEKNILYSFGINIRYRSKENVMEWIDCVKKKLKANFTCILNKKNTRAISFMIKNGLSKSIIKDEYVLMNLN